MTIQTTDERPLETLVGLLNETFPKFERDTILHSDQLTTERRTIPELRDKWLYTADSNIYTSEDGEVIWYLGREQTNPFFNDIEGSTQELELKGNYIPPIEDIEAVKNAVETGETLKVKLSDLMLQGNDFHHKFFEIETENYDNLNPEQRRVAERVYGQGDDFVENMKMFNENGMKKVSVYVLNPDYVKNNVPLNRALAQAPRLFQFGIESRFDAGGGLFGSHGDLCGVRNVAESDTQKIEYGSIAGTLNDPKFNPLELARQLNPEGAKTLTETLGGYISQQKQ